jgi:hypothetical protein
VMVVGGAAKVEEPLLPLSPVSRAVARSAG